MLLYTQEIYIICKYVGWKMFIQLCKENNIRLNWIVNIASPHFCSLSFFFFFFLPSSSVYVCVGAVSAFLFSLIEVENKKNSYVKFKHFFNSVIIFFIFNLFQKRQTRSEFGIQYFSILFFLKFILRSITNVLKSSVIKFLPFANMMGFTVYTIIGWKWCQLISLEHMIRWFFI